MRGRFQPTPLTNVPLGDEEEDGGDGHNSDIPFQNEGEKNSLEKAAPLQLEKSEESYLSRRSESGYHLVMSDSSSMRHQRTQSIDSASSSNAAPSALSWKILNKGTVNLRDFVLTQDGVFLSGKRLDLEVIPMDDIDTEGLELIGKGASGTVYKARHKPTGKLLALKKIRVEERKHRDEITKELSVLQRMNSQSCPYLTRHYGAYYDAESSTIDMPMEWMDGTLTTAIHLVGYIWEDVLRLIAYQVVQALVVLHRSHVIHRDIKPGNILLNGDGYVKVSDFGISKVVGTDGDQMGCTFVGTQVYMSPERLVSEGPHSYSSDIWALGLTLVQCATGRNPWYTVVPEGSPVNVFVIKNCTDQGLCPRLHHDAPDTNAGHPEPGQSPQPSQVPDTSKEHPSMDTKKSTMWSPAACNFIECCVQIDPQARPTATQLTHHPFLRGITDASATQGIKAFVVNLARLASVYKKKHARTNSGALEKALSALDEMIQGGKAGSP